MGRMRVRRIAPWVAAGLTVAGVVFAIVLDALAGSHGEETWAGVAWATAGAGVERGGPGARHPPPHESDRLAAAGERARAGRASGWRPLTRTTRLLEDPGALPGAEWAVLFHERAWPTLFICADRDRASCFPTAGCRHRGGGRIAIVAGGVVRRADRGVAACGRALQRAVRARLQPASRAVRVRRRAPVHRSAAWARWPASWQRRWPLRTRMKRASLRRAPAAQVARLRGGAGSRRRSWPA